MPRRWLVFALLLAAACGTPTPPPPATVQSVALRQADLPGGMVLCGLSGDIDSFLTGAPANNQYATQLQEAWNALKAQGAQKGYVRVFAKSQTDCKSAFTSSTTNAMPLVSSMVVQFKNTPAAAKAYTQADVGAAPIASLPGAQQGVGTGLGKNSLTFGDDEGSQTLFFAYWQSGRFLNLFLGVDIGVSQSRRAALHVNSRIH